MIVRSTNIHVRIYFIAVHNKYHQQLLTTHSKNETFGENVMP